MLEKSLITVISRKLNKVSFPLECLNIVRHNKETGINEHFNIESFADVIKADKLGFIRLHCVDYHHHIDFYTVELEIFIFLEKGTKINSCRTLKSETFLNKLPFVKDGIKELDRQMLYPLSGTRLLGVCMTERRKCFCYSSVKLTLEDKSIAVIDEGSACLAEKAFLNFCFLGKRVYYSYSRFIGTDIFIGFDAEKFDFVKKRYVYRVDIDNCFLERITCLIHGEHKNSYCSDVYERKS